MTASIVAPSGRVAAARFTSPRVVPCFALRSTVRYRVDGRAITGIIVGISHFDGFRYDIRPLQSAKSRTPARISFGVAHEDIEKLISPPPHNQEVIVLSDLPPDTPQPVEEEPPRAAHNWLFGPAARVAAAVGLRAGSAPPLSPESSPFRS